MLLGPVGFSLSLSLPPFLKNWGQTKQRNKEASAKGISRSGLFHSVYDPLHLASTEAHFDGGPHHLHVPALEWKSLMAFR
ncbi:hypothetical protein chiPu_0012432 [Chiloscyllium punctatum]|uniref:Uncharacterized protein n=1 Tax=Chiloscyllium punctatum TaxID=137246 RepID=A0A401SU89_CHIPU|nr:hypothetical protein [Chiloscyllium punctatum]